MHQTLLTEGHRMANKMTMCKAVGILGKKMRHSTCDKKTYMI